MARITSTGWRSTYCRARVIAAPRMRHFQKRPESVSSSRSSPLCSASPSAHDAWLPPWNGDNKATRIEVSNLEFPFVQAVNALTRPETQRRLGKLSPTSVERVPLGSHSGAQPLSLPPAIGASRASSCRRPRRWPGRARLAVCCQRESRSSYRRCRYRTASGASS